jgi:hypothetical protein
MTVMYEYNATVKYLTDRISRILDGANSLTNINMSSKAGRRMVATVIAQQLATTQEGEGHSMESGRGQ